MPRKSRFFAAKASTRRREADLRGKGIRFFGMGVSGGEEGARHGPSIMVGGTEASWKRVEKVITAISAKFKGEPCAAWLGPDGAGHFVKTIHNGIEYADMQMIAEIYGVMRDGLALDAPRIGEVFATWNEGPLQSYLIDITARIAATRDRHSGRPILDVILDKAGQKGTGRWTAIEAQHLAAPVPVIEAAVMARNVSARIRERRAMQARFGPAPQPCTAQMPQLEGALIAGKILCYAQGFAMIRAASDRFGWALPLPQIARVWRAGCIIRSAMLNDMAAALAEDADRNLILAPFFAELIQKTAPALRQTVAAGVASGHPMPALASGLIWFDMMRTARGTANMIQAQRDFFGLHGFERLDGIDDPHGPWAA